MDPNSRIDYADAIRAFAITSVVFLHVASPIAQSPGTFPAAWWWIANAVYSCARPSIALFVMVSGLLLLSPSKEEGIGFFLRKRFVKIAVPFIGWGIIYFFWKTHMQVSPRGFVRLAREFVEGPVYYHLWFIYTIAGIYLATPVFRVYVKNASRSNQAYLLLLWIIGTSVYPVIRHFSGINVGIPILVAGGFLGAFLLGNFLRPFQAGTRSGLWLGLLAALCLGFTAVSEYFLSSRLVGAYDGTFEDFLSPNVVAAATCIFLIIKSLPLETLRRRVPVLNKIMAGVSGASFSIYLMHILVLEILKGHVPGVVIDGCFIHPVVGIPVTAVGTIAVCVFVTLVMRRVPVVRQMFPS